MTYLSPKATPQSPSSGDLELPGPLPLSPKGAAEYGLGQILQGHRQGHRLAACLPACKGGLRQGWHLLVLPLFPGWGRVRCRGRKSASAAQRTGGVEDGKGPTEVALWGCSQESLSSAPCQGYQILRLLRSAEIRVPPAWCSRASGPQISWDSACNLQGPQATSIEGPK